MSTTTPRNGLASTAAANVAPIASRKGAQPWRTPDRSWLSLRGSVASLASN